MAFRVQSIRTGEYFTFSAKEILHLIGDSINDEINLDGEVYRISTCEELASGNGAIANIDWQADTLEINSNGETVFYFPAQSVGHIEPVFNSQQCLVQLRRRR